jgi:predicted Zn-dependent peptidase
MERHEVPTIAFHTYVRAGSVDDPSGQTGMAHMLEHMTFRGSETIGSRDWAGEKKALDAIEEAYERLEAERNKGPQADVGKVGASQVLVNRAVEQARAWTKPGEFLRLLEENGAVRPVATATPDAIESSYSLPANRLDLWFAMESQRLLHPVFRDFYTEREAVAEEYSQHLDKTPQVRLSQALLATALSAHPYRNPPWGWPGDLASLRVKQARDFFERNYVPGNITIAVAGDVMPAEVKRLAERYFGAMPSRPVPPLVHTSEPPQTGPKTVVVEASGQPMMMVGYQRPEDLDPDGAVFTVIQSVLGAGKHGWIYKELMEEKKITAFAQANSYYPGVRYPGLFTVLLMASAGHTVDENQKALDDLLNRLILQRLDAPAMARARAQARIAMLERLESNAGWAAMLAGYQGAYGDWRRLFKSAEEVERVTADDVLRVARKYLKLSNRTLAYTAPPPARAVPAIR